IATNNGRFMNVASVVGYPKDFIALKLIKKQVVYGNECLRHRMSVDMMQPLKNGVIASSSKSDSEIEEKAAREFVKYLVSLTEKKEDQKMYVVVGAPARASVQDKQTIAETLKDMVDGVLVVSEPFLVAYGMGLFGFAVIVDIGAGTLDICRMHGTLPDKNDQVTFSKAGNHIDEIFYKMLKEKIPNAHITPLIARRIKEQHAFVGHPKEKVVVDFIVSGNAVQNDITNEIRDACATIMPDVIIAVKDLINGFDPEYQKDLRENIIIAGCGNRIAGLNTALEKDLADLGNVKIHLVEDPIYAGAIGGLKLAQDMPPSEWESI
ncbi:rod shape-determining protein, partial [candidate division KSB1 bacterium]